MTAAIRGMSREFSPPPSFRSVRDSGSSFPECNSGGGGGTEQRLEVELRLELEGRRTYKIPLPPLPCEKSDTCTCRDEFMSSTSVKFPAKICNANVQSLKKVFPGLRDGLAEMLCQSPLLAMWRNNAACQSRNMGEIF